MIKKFFRNDFNSSVVVFLVALPLCLGIALASGAPMFSGIVAGIIGGIVVGALSGSPLSVTGPAAGLTSIVAMSITDLGSYPAFLLSVVLAGIFQIILGYARAGGIGHFFPHSVIKGMLAAIGVILILKQIPHAVGYDVDFEGDESFIQDDGQNTFTEIINALEFMTPGAVIAGITSIIILLAWERPILRQINFIRQIPAALVAVVSGVLLNMLFINYFPEYAIEPKHLVSLPDIKADGIGSLFIFPDFSFWKNPAIYLTAVTIAIVASIESLLSIEACDKLDPYRRITPLNRELKAQGAGNLISGLIGGLPVTSVIVRSSANINSGAQSKASTISHGILLMTTFLFIPGLLQMIPLASLAGILIMIGFKLTKPGLYKAIYRQGVSQFLPFIVTVVAVVFTNLLQGVFMGIMVGLFFILKTNFKQAVIMVNNDDNYLIKFTKDVSFLHKAALRENLGKVPRNSRLTVDGSQAQFIDHDIIETLIDFQEESKTRNIQVDLINIKNNY